MVALPAILAGVGVAQKLLSHKKKYNNRRAIAELRASRPTGYLTPEDMRASELTRGRLAEGVQAQGRLGGYEIARRFQARGLAGSPAEERSRARLEQGTALGIQHAGESAEEQLYNIRTGREAYQHQADLAIFGAQTGETQRESERAQAQDSAFWNSLNEFMPTILSALPKTTPDATVTPTTAPGMPGPTGFVNPAAPGMPGPAGFVPATPMPTTGRRA